MPAGTPLVTSLLAALAVVPEHRRAAGRRHALPAVLAFLSCGCCAGDGVCSQSPSGAERMRPVLRGLPLPPLHTVCQYPTSHPDRSGCRRLRDGPADLD
jgi:hypothetical protein